MFCMARQTEKSPASAMACRPSTWGGCAVRVIGDNNRHAGIEQALDPDPCEVCRSFLIERRGEHCTFGLHVLPEGSARFAVPNENEIPGLTKPDAGSGMGGRQHPLQGVRIDRASGELPSDVAPAMDRAKQGVGI
jgi:hypothetical protein